MEKTYFDALIANVVAIIPITDQKTDYRFPWHPTLQPVGKSYTAIQKVIAQACFMGVSSVWLVCNKNMQPLIKKVVGERLRHPSTYYLEKRDKKHPVPIYYVPVHIRDRHKAACPSWSVLHGCLEAYEISGLISKWTLPDRFLVFDPYLMCDYYDAIYEKKHVKQAINFSYKSEGKTYKDGVNVPFTLSYGDCIEAKEKYDELAYEFYEENSMVEGSIKIPLDKIFNSVKIDRDFEIGKTYDIRKWEGYMEYMRSDRAAGLHKPSFVGSYSFAELFKPEEEDD